MNSDIKHSLFLTGILTFKITVIFEMPTLTFKDHHELVDVSIYIYVPCDIEYYPNFMNTIPIVTSSKENRHRLCLYNDQYNVCPCDSRFFPVIFVMSCQVFFELWVLNLPLLFVFIKMRIYKRNNQNHK